MKKCMTAMKRALSLALVLTLLVTGMPVNAFAAAAAELRTPVSAPLEQPTPIDYAAMLPLQEEAGSDSQPAEAPPESDITAASDADAAVSSSDASSAPSAPAEGETPDASSAPSASSGPEVPDASSTLDASSVPEQTDSSSDPAASLPTQEEPAEPDPPVSENDPDSAVSSEGEEPAEEHPDEEQPSEPAELRLPFVREKYDPYQALYGDPVEVTEYSRVYARRSRARSANSRQEFIAVISPVPNTYTDENGQEQPIDNTLIVTEDSGAATY